MSDECRICSCHDHRHGRRSAGALSATLLVSGRAVNLNGSVELRGLLDLEHEIVHLRFDVFRTDGCDGIESGTLSLELSELDALLEALLAHYPALARRWRRSGG
jgi:hypothetical protein